MRAAMNPELRSLIHQTNNLLGVIYTQVELARRLPGEAAKLQSLTTIEAAAQRLAGEIKQLRSAANRDGGDGDERPAR
jgi:hypothetical protein